VPSAAQLALAELLLLLAVGCKDARSQRGSSAAASASASAAASLRSWLAPRASSRLICGKDSCRQDYPRLPSSGEWRCAEQPGTVWCAGGEPAAGVVAGTIEAGFRCGPRWGGKRQERICIDRDPEYSEDPTLRQCRFHQEEGIVRGCTRNVAQAPVAPRLSDRALAACWIDSDCPSKHCDRGACACGNDAECQVGQCRDAHCAEARP
jgi:hypothetical protein